MGGAAVQEAEALPSGLFIAGRWASESGGGTMEHVNPATGRVQRTFPVAGVAEVNESVAAAKAALGDYRQWSPADRRDLLLRIAALCRSHAAEFATIGTLECGMIQPVANGMGASAAKWFEYYAGWTDKIVGEVTPGAGLNYTLIEPYGVVAVILTWNGPTGSIGMKVAAALAAGCTVVLKPPELAPFSSNLFARICVEAGLPSGVLNVIPGGPEAGTALVSHPDVDKISFTGGPGTARAIQKACADSLTPLILELGGKSANIVFEDADIEHAAAVAVRGLTRLSGQVCHAPTRLLIQDSVYAAVTGRVAELLDAVQVGLPTDAASAMGPVISGPACDRIMSVIEGARRDAAGRLLAGGNRLGGELAEGFFIRPTAFGDVDNQSPLAQQEVFGPVLAAMRFRDEEEAIELANATPYGLAGHLQTKDLARAHRVAARLDAGNVSVNGGLVNAGPEAPFGGVKDSGYGKEGGRAGIEEYVRVKNVNVNLA
jgi:acyl-CoA reductase-like NAD-dependent aldehyde dehydrogenase